MATKEDQGRDVMAAAAADLYATLGVSREADPAVIKRAYLQLARETHPDRCPGDESANARFQAVGRAYAILRDPEKRRVYDAAGIIDDGSGPPTGSGATGWYDFWRDFYSRVTSEKLDALAQEYRGSEEEAADLRAAYTTTKGNMGKIIDHMMHASIDDEPRFRELLDAAISEGSLPRLSAFASEPEAKRRKRQAKAAKEAAEAEAHAKKLGLGSGSDALAAAIVARNQQREGGRDAFLNSLAQRFGGDDEEAENGGASGRGGKARGGKARGGKATKGAPTAMDADPLDDAAFAAAQAKMLSGTKSAKGQR